MKTNSKRKKREQLFIEEKLKEIPLNKLSKQSKFCKRKPRKISPKEFLKGFFLMIDSSGKISYKNWASKIGLLIGDTVSKQVL